MRLSDHFDLAEFTTSDTALRLRIDNTLPRELVQSALQTARMLERIRAHLQHPVIITSGYRCQALNRAIRSKDTSDHVLAMAADIRCPGFGDAMKVARELSLHMNELEIGQLIYEFGSWVHVSTRHPPKLINRVISINHSGTWVGIQA